MASSHMDKSAANDGICLSIPTYDAYSREIRAGRLQNAMNIGRVSLAQATADRERVLNGWPPNMVPPAKVQTELESKPFNPRTGLVIVQFEDDVEWCASVKARVAALGMTFQQFSLSAGYDKQYLSNVLCPSNSRGQKCRDRLELALANAEQVRLFA